MWNGESVGNKLKSIQVKRDTAMVEESAGIV